MADLIAVAYPEEGTAQKVLDTLTRLGREYLIDLADACYVTRGQDGKVQLHQAVNLTAAGATSGALWGGLVGLLFLMPLAGLIVGGATGALVGKLTDVGIDDAMMKSLGEQLQPGSSALFVLVRSVTADKVLPEVQQYGGTVLKSSLSKEQEARLRAVLAEGHAAAATAPDAAPAPATAPAPAPEATPSA
jgi:uncharacterized membrane protein